MTALVNLRPVLAVHLPRLVTMIPQQFIQTTLVLIQNSHMIVMATVLQILMAMAFVTL